MWTDLISRPDVGSEIQTRGNFEESAGPCCYMLCFQCCRWSDTVSQLSYLCKHGLYRGAVCLATASFCYTKTYFTLRHHQAEVLANVHEGQPDQGGIPLNIARYRKTVSSALWIQMTLVFCYLPYAVAAAIRTVTGSHTQPFNLAWAELLSFI